MRVRLRFWLLVALCGVQACVLTEQTLHCSPSQDELGQMTASIAIAQTGDPGYYRVNPPLGKLVTGIPLTLLRDVPEIPSASPSYFHPGNRHQEVSMPRQYINARLDGYRWDFRVGRLPRVILLVLVTWGVLWWFYRRGCDGGLARPEATPTLVFATLWCTSPLMLGHGWTMMPDALSGVAMLGVLVSSIAWLRGTSRFGRSWEASLVIGVCWGLAISTKFTFCPVYVLWPIALVAHEVVLGRHSWRHLGQVLLAHLGHGVIAWGVLLMAYNFFDLGVTFADHHFASDRMLSIFGHDWIAAVRSPFPMQFLVGIDEQQLDLERGHPTYVLGNWYPDGVWWYYLFGLAAKESIAMWVAVLVFPIGVWRLVRRGDRERLAELTLVALSAVFVIVVLSANFKMGLNVRYAIPALPGMYWAAAIALTARSRAEPGNEGVGVWLSLGLLIIALVETGYVFPNHFAYINPLVGGMHRVPAVLHDSNFDGEQDIWRLERQLADGRFDDEDLYLVLNTKIPADGFAFDVRQPSRDVIETLLRQRTEPAIERSAPPATLIVSRGFEAPMPWTSRFGQRSRPSQTLQDLLRLPSDEWVTPTIVVYRSRSTLRPEDE